MDDNKNSYDNKNLIGKETGDLKQIIENTQLYHSSTQRFDQSNQNQQLLDFQQQNTTTDGGYQQALDQIQEDPDQENKSITEKSWFVNQNDVNSYAVVNETVNSQSIVGGATFQVSTKVNGKETIARQGVLKQQITQEVTNQRNQELQQNQTKVKKNWPEDIVKFNKWIKELEERRSPQGVRMIKEEIMEFVNDNLPEDQPKYEAEVMQAAMVAERNIEFQKNQQNSAKLENMALPRELQIQGNINQLSIIQSEPNDSKTNNQSQNQTGYEINKGSVKQTTVSSVLREQTSDIKVEVQNSKQEFQIVHEEKSHELSKQNQRPALEADKIAQSLQSSQKMQEHTQQTLPDGNTNESNIAIKPEPRNFTTPTDINQAISNGSMIKQKGKIVVDHSQSSVLPPANSLNDTDLKTIRQETLDQDLTNELNIIQNTFDTGNEGGDQTNEEEKIHLKKLKKPTKKVKSQKRRISSPSTSPQKMDYDKIHETTVSNIDATFGGDDLNDHEKTTSQQANESNFSMRLKQSHLKRQEQKLHEIQRQREEILSQVQNQIEINERFSKTPRSGEDENSQRSTQRDQFSIRSGKRALLKGQMAQAQDIISKMKNYSSQIKNIMGQAPNEQYVPWIYEPPTRNQLTQKFYEQTINHSQVFSRDEPPIYHVSPQQNLASPPQFLPQIDQKHDLSKSVDITYRQKEFMTKNQIEEQQFLQRPKDLFPSLNKDLRSSSDNKAQIQSMRMSKNISKMTMNTDFVSPTAAHEHPGNYIEHQMRRTNVKIHVDSDSAPSQDDFDSNKANFQKVKRTQGKFKGLLKEAKAKKRLASERWIQDDESVIVDTIAESFSKNINAFNNQKKYVIFSDADESEQASMQTKHNRYNNPSSKDNKLMSKAKKGFRTLKNYSDQPPDLEQLLQSGACSNVEKPPKGQLRKKRKILEQQLLDIGHDPKNTISYHSKSELVQSLVTRNKDVLNWKLSSVQNTKLVDVQLERTEKDLCLAPNKIETPEVFQNHFVGFERAVDQVKQEKLESLSFVEKEMVLNSGYVRYQRPGEWPKKGSLIVFKQLIYIKQINPLKAFTLRYKFFQAGQNIYSEGDMVQNMILQDYNLRIDSKFNRKLSETVQDVLQRIQNSDEINLKNDDIQAQQSQISMFQAIELHFAINAKTGRPDLFDIIPNFLELPVVVERRPIERGETEDPKDSIMSIPESYKDCLSSLLLKLDKQIRNFNGLQQNPKYSSIIFTTFWQKVVDKDLTEVDVRYETHLNPEPIQVQIKDEGLDIDKQNLFILDQQDKQNLRNQRMAERDPYSSAIVMSQYKALAAQSKQLAPLQERDEVSDVADSDTQFDINALYEDQYRNDKIHDIKNKKPLRQKSLAGDISPQSFIQRIKHNFDDPLSDSRSMVDNLGIKIDQMSQGNPNQTQQKFLQNEREDVFLEPKPVKKSTIKKDGVKYVIKFKNYGDSEDSWTFDPKDYFGKEEQIVKIQAFVKMQQYQQRYLNKVFAINFIQNHYRNVLLSREARFETHRVVKLVRGLNIINSFRMEDLSDAFERLGEVSGKEKGQMIKIRGLIDQKIHLEMGKNKKGKGKGKNKGQIEIKVELASQTDQSQTVRNAKAGPQSNRFSQRQKANQSEITRIVGNAKSSSNGKDDAESNQTMAVKSIAPSYKNEMSPVKRKSPSQMSKTPSKLEKGKKAVSKKRQSPSRSMIGSDQGKRDFASQPDQDIPKIPRPPKNIESVSQSHSANIDVDAKAEIFIEEETKSHQLHEQNKILSGQETVKRPKVNPRASQETPVLNQDYEPKVDKHEEYSFLDPDHEFVLSSKQESDATSMALGVGKITQKSQIQVYEQMKLSKSKHKMSMLSQMKATPAFQSDQDFVLSKDESKAAQQDVTQSEAIQIVESSEIDTKIESVKGSIQPSTVRPTKEPLSKPSEQNKESSGVSKLKSVLNTKISNKKSSLVSQKTPNSNSQKKELAKVTPSEHTLSSHRPSVPSRMRNADSEGDEGPIADHAPMGQQFKKDQDKNNFKLVPEATKVSIEKSEKKTSTVQVTSDANYIQSDAVEQSDNPIENFDKVKAPVQKKPWQKAKAAAKQKKLKDHPLPKPPRKVDDQEGRDDQQQPFQNFASSKEDPYELPKDQPEEQKPKDRKKSESPNDKKKPQHKKQPLLKQQSPFKSQSSQKAPIQRIEKDESISEHSEEQSSDNILKVTKDPLSNPNLTNLPQDKEIVIEKYSEEEDNSQTNLNPAQEPQQSPDPSLQGTLYEIHEPDSAAQSIPNELTNEEPVSLKKLKKRQPLSSEEDTPMLKPKIYKKPKGQGNFETIDNSQSTASLSKYVGPPMNLVNQRYKKNLPLNRSLNPDQQRKNARQNSHNFIDNKNDAFLLASKRRTKLRESTAEFFPIHRFEKPRRNPNAITKKKDIYLPSIGNQSITKKSSQGSIKDETSFIEKFVNQNGEFFKSPAQKRNVIGQSQSQSSQNFSPQTPTNFASQSLPNLSPEKPNIDPNSQQKFNSIERQLLLEKQIMEQTIQIQQIKSLQNQLIQQKQLNQQLMANPQLSLTSPQLSQLDSNPFQTQLQNASLDPGSGLFSGIQQLPLQSPHPTSFNQSPQFDEQQIARVNNNNYNQDITNNSLLQQSPDLQSAQNSGYNAAMSNSISGLPQSQVNISQDFQRQVLPPPNLRNSSNSINFKGLKKGIIPPPYIAKAPVGRGKKGLKQRGTSDVANKNKRYI